MSSHKSYSLVILIILFGGLILAAAAAGIGESHCNKDVVIVLKEMQSAHYFGFVMLIKMLNDSVPCNNITFLMPNDRMLSNVAVPENAVSEFLMRHSIATPLTFRHLQHFPTGTIIPTYEPGFALKISNGGRRNFHFNGVKIVHPDICTFESSIRCHGIDRVLSVAESRRNTTALPQLSCDPPSLPSSPPVPATPPAPGTPKSESPDKRNVGLVWAIASCLILLVVELQI